ncbi:hypothetical protein Peur_026946 [Populus x canadensis]
MEFNDKQATACLRRDRVLGLRGGSEREKSSGLPTHFAILHRLDPPILHHSTFLKLSQFFTILHHLDHPILASVQVVEGTIPIFRSCFLLGFCQIEMGLVDT